MISLKACAKEKTVEDVLSAQPKIFSELNFVTMAPVMDGYFLPGINFIKVKGKNTGTCTRPARPCATDVDC